MKTATQNNTIRNTTWIPYGTDYRSAGGLYTLEYSRATKMYTMRTFAMGDIVDTAPWDTCINLQITFDALGAA